MSCQGAGFKKPTITWISGNLTGYGSRNGVRVETVAASVLALNPHDINAVDFAAFALASPNGASPIPPVNDATTTRDALDRVINQLMNDLNAGCASENANVKSDVREARAADDVVERAGACKRRSDGFTRGKPAGEHAAKVGFARGRRGPPAAFLRHSRLSRRRHDCRRRRPRARVRKRCRRRRRWMPGRLGRGSARRVLERRQRPYSAARAQRRRRRGDEDRDRLLHGARSRRDRETRCRRPDGSGVHSGHRRGV